jgi:16S rRNA G1207 methylase RsmC
MPTPEIHLPTPALRRYPVRKGELLQAWDAADELLLEHLRDHPEDLGTGAKRILIVGDDFGALTGGLQGYQPTTYTDSFLSTRGITSNVPGAVSVVNRLADLQGPFDLFVVRIPKNLSFFEDILAHLSALASPGAKLVAGYRIKHQANGAFDLLEKYVGPTTTSLARKKARLIFSTFTHPAAKSPFPLTLEFPGFPIPFVNHSNVFSRERLDIGTRFFLDHLPSGSPRAILDLGCGNGIVGIDAKRKHPGARVIFTDESRMAVDSAAENYRATFGGAFEGDAEFLWTNSAQDVEPNRVDLVLCNPPFHQGTTIGDFVAREMFQDALRVLAPGGILRVIGNTHLRYPFALRNLFGNSTIVATNAKFQIVDAIKSP